MILAFWHFHKWAKWELLEKGELFGSETRRPEEDMSIGSYEIQRRVCNVCGMAQLRMERGE